MTNLELWTCADQGVTRAEIDALGATGWHNWGSWKTVPSGPGRVPLVSLKLDKLPILGTVSSGLVMLGNEPQMPPPDGDGYTNAARDAGVRARLLASDLVFETTAILGNFFCADQSKQAGTCYDGTVQTIDAGPAYWAAYHSGYYPTTSTWPKAVGWGIHYYTRGATFDVNRLIAILGEYHAWCNGDVYLTELGVEPWGFDTQACMGFMEQLVMWAVGKPWMRAICWCQWPTRYADSGLYKNGSLTPLGVYWRDLGERIKGLTPVVDPPPGPTSSQWERVSQNTFTSIQSNGGGSDLFRITVEREVRP